MVFYATNLYCNDTLGRGQSGLIRWRFGMNHAPGAGLIARPINQQSSSLPLAMDTPTKISNNRIRCANYWHIHIRKPYSYFNDTVRFLDLSFCILLLWYRATYIFVSTVAETINLDIHLLRATLLGPIHLPVFWIFYEWSMQLCDQNKDNLLGLQIT